MANEQTKWLPPVSKSQITRFDCIKKQGLTVFKNNV